MFWEAFSSFVIVTYGYPVQTEVWSLIQSLVFDIFEGFGDFAFYKIPQADPMSLLITSPENLPERLSWEDEQENE